MPNQSQVAEPENQQETRTVIPVYIWLPGLFFAGIFLYQAVGDFFQKEKKDNLEFSLSEAIEWYIFDQAKVREVFKELQLNEALWSNFVAETGKDDLAEVTRFLTGADLDGDLLLRVARLLENGALHEDVKKEIRKKLRARFPGIFEGEVEILMDVPLVEIAIDIKWRKALAKKGILTIGDLLKRYHESGDSLHFIEKIPGCGPLALQRIREILKAMRLI